METVRVNSKIYYALRSSKGGIRTLAMYLHIREGRGNKPYYKAFKSANNKLVSGYNLLHQKTNISISALKKYVPELVALNLISFDDIGNVHIKGTKQINKEYKSKKGIAKIVPIIITEKFTKTADAAIVVSLSSEFNSQKTVIKLKKAVVSEKAKKFPKDLKKFQRIEKALEKRYGKRKAKKITECTTLSNLSFFFIKNTNEKYSKKKVVNNTSKGHYIKKKLVKMNLLKSKRRFERVLNTFVDYEGFLRVRKERSQYDLRYINGMVVREITASASLVEGRSCGRFIKAMQ
jgi:hypothetical protein